MRRFVLVAFITLALAVTSIRAADGFDFGDMPPLPPPLLDDSPPPPPLNTPSASQLTPPPATLTGTTGAADLAPPPSFPSGFTEGLLAQPSTPAPTTPTTPSIPSAAEIGAPTDTGMPLLPPSMDTFGQAALPTETASPIAPPSLEAAPTPMIPETPRPAKITGGRVNVRAGPNTQYESIAVLTTGVPVTVLARHGEWFKIIFPSDQLASIHKTLVDADITGEIPEAGLPGIVNQDNADVHAYYWDKSTVVGQLNKGDPVIIKQERGQWYRIDAPDTARAYVSAQYVRLDGGGEVAVDSAPAPVNPAVDLTAGRADAAGKLVLSEDDRRVAAIKEAYFNRLREQEAAREEEVVETVNRLTEALDDFDARLAELDREASSLLAYPVETTQIGSAAWAPPDPLYGGYTGWLENIGRVGGAPASFRLTKGGEIRFYLRSDRFNLADYVGRRVFVNGAIELAAGANANVLNVSEVRPLTDSEIAEGMRQTATMPQPYIPPQPVADPFSQYYADTSQIIQPGVIINPPVTTETVMTQPTVTTTVVTQTTEPFVYSGSVAPLPVAPTPDPYALAPGQIIQAQPVYDSYATYPTQPVGAPTMYQPAPAQPAPTDPSMLPDVVGYGVTPQTPSPGLVSSPGEVESDYYDTPVIREMGP
ncbi:MAG: SH3 domain-containing protein [Planctomycetes bacterium]|nr:SH3 domain-containing protein [Planctomycetota bacterium]